MTGEPADPAALLEYVQGCAEAERAHCASVLHDELGGALVGIKMQLAALERASAADLHERLARVRQQLDAAIAIRQRLEERLHPGLIEHVGLFAALRAHAEQLAASGAGTYHLQLPSAEVPLPPPARIVLYRAAQSAMRVLAGGGAVRITAQLVGPRLEVRISGPDPVRAFDNEHLELEAARQRLIHFGGELVHARESEGESCVRIRVPVSHSLDAARKSR